MKRINLILIASIISLHTFSQDKVYATFLDGERIRSISANPSTGATTGSFTNVKNIIESAALGMTTDGYLVYLEYGDDATGSEDGKVDIWVTKADGTGSAKKVYNNFDVNGSSNAELGFVRLGVDQNNVAWILSKEISGTTMYLAKFQVNGTNNVSPARAGTVVTSDNNNNGFQNGDLCFDGLGNMYALSNIYSGSTKMYIIKADALAAATSSSVTTAAYKWDIKAPNGNNFVGRVTGCAFSSTGSMFVSTDNGLYFIDQFTTNFHGTGTVSCIKVKDQSDLSDLATGYWPAHTDLPVKFHSFEVKPLGNYAYEVSFTVVEAEDVDSFEVEILKDGKWIPVTIPIPLDAANPNKTYKVRVQL